MYDDKSFLGQGWSFPPTFEKSFNSGVVMVSDEKDIMESLEILMTTNPGERVMLPEYGCGIQSFLFDSISNTKIHFLKELIRTAILNYEPRIELHEIHIDISEYLEGIVKIGLDYSIEVSNTRFNLVFPYYKVEGTDIPEMYQKEITKIS
ncbi:GPW/gp25 family protein [Ascidiimonas sp. W6]|uniref:GPW/gp25 family protein n=1 Tax=Ascidiimonas meishanensis TaxID=3128903 RepID=UPI0030EE990C